MNDLYPPESQKLDVVGHLEELRQRIIAYLICLVLAGGLLFVKGKALLNFVKRPLNGLVEDLIFITPTEVFVSYFKVVLLFGFIVTFPVLLYEAWAFLAPAADRAFRRRILVWLALALVCLVGGMAFSYYAALPAALKFLFAFGRDIATPQITLAKYISFFMALMLIGGIIFETPIVLGLLTDIGLISSGLLREKRKYAVFFIFVFSAVITPTQDIFNMLVFAVPMIVLFEVGIGISRLIEQRKLSKG